jgi:hypothetical protein
MDDSKIPWDWVILGALRTGSEADLSEIYDTIDRVKKQVQQLSVCNCSISSPDGESVPNIITLSEPPLVA